MPRNTIIYNEYYVCHSGIDEHALYFDVKDVDDDLLFKIKLNRSSDFEITFADSLLFTGTESLTDFGHALNRIIEWCYETLDICQEIEKHD